jgi:hypothetical protein
MTRKVLFRFCMCGRIVVAFTYHIYGLECIVKLGNPRIKNSNQTLTNVPMAVDKVQLSLKSSDNAYRSNGSISTIDRMLDTHLAYFWSGNNKDGYKV